MLAPIRPGSKVVLLNFEETSVRTHDYPYAFFGSYSRARGAELTSWTYAELAHWPIRYVDGKAPPAHVPFWSFKPCHYRYVKDGDFYDYVLVQGAMNPFSEASPGPRFEAVAHAGRFTLFEKRAPAATSTLDDDRGPCSSPRE